jgi:hypothetical protein
MLDSYLDHLTSYAETVCDTYLDGSNGSRPISRARNSGEDGPINENESAPRAISPTLPEPDLESYDEGKEREAAVARLKTLEPRVKATRDEMKKKETRLVAQRAEIEAAKAREKESQRQLEALDDEREKDDPSTSGQEATHDLNGQTKTDGTLYSALESKFAMIEAIECSETVEEITEAEFDPLQELLWSCKRMPWKRIPCKRVPCKRVPCKRMPRLFVREINREHRQNLFTTPF